jgi:hypothetical protein
MSAFDDKELLLQGIELGVFRFLTKPVNVEEFAEVLYKAILEIKHEQHTKLFYSHLKNIFDYQSSMLLMLHEKDLVLANDMFLEFFDYECVKECKKSFYDIGEKFLAHNQFLYNHDEVNVVDTLLLNPQKLFHVKVASRDDSLKHFIVKYQEIPEKEGYGVLSFDDITELNLLELFDSKQNRKDTQVLNTKAMLNLLEVIERNGAEIEMHNYYKGLSITNSARIVEIKEDSISLKMSYIQLKAIQLEEKTYFISSALPDVVQATEILKISFAKEEVELKSLSFVKTSPLERATIRVVPDERQSASLFLGKNKYQGDIEIEDISLDAIRLKLQSLPAGLNEESEIILDIVLELERKPLIINTAARLFKKSESQHSFSIVFMFKELKNSALVDYITTRQRELIREIKRMQNGY